MSRSLLRALLPSGLLLRPLPLSQDPQETFCSTDLVYLFRLISRILWTLVENRQSALFCRPFFQMDLVAWSELGVGGQCMGVGGVDSPSVFSLPLPGFPSLVRGESMAAGGC